MATGAIHYSEAEKALECGHQAPRGSVVERYYLATAQVHATLALAAATALSFMHVEPGGLPDEDAIEWIAAAGHKLPAEEHEGGEH